MKNKEKVTKQLIGREVIYPSVKVLEVSCA